MTDQNQGVLSVLAATLREVGKPVAAAARPLAKAGVRSLLAVRDRGQELIAEAGETLSDIVAEVRAEREAERAASVATAREDATGGIGSGERQSDVAEARQTSEGIGSAERESK